MSVLRTFSPGVHDGDEVLVVRSSNVSSRPVVSETWVRGRVSKLGRPKSQG